MIKTGKNENIITIYLKEDFIMALLTCPECTHTVSDKAFSCPGCGYPFRSFQNITTPGSFVSTPSQQTLVKTVPKQ